MAAVDIPSGFFAAGFSPGFLDRSGPYWLKPDEAGTIVGLRVEDGHLNYQAMAHGGLITTLADVALSYCIYASTRPSPIVATAALTVNFLGAARLHDWLEAEARIDRMGKRLCHASGTIRRSGTTIATMSGVFSVMQGD